MVGFSHSKNTPKVPNTLYWGKDASDIRRAPKNYNSLYNFKDSRDVEIVCRHYSVVIGAAKIQHDANKQSPHFADEILALVGNKERTRNNIQWAQAEQRFDELCQYSPERHLVMDRRWGDFLHDRMAQLAPNESVQFLLHTGRHAMTMGLKCKESADKQRTYVATLHDANETNQNARIFTTQLEDVMLWGIDKFFPREDRDFYGMETCGFIRMPKDFSLSKPVTPTTKKERHCSYYLDGFESPQALGNLMVQGFNLEPLKQRLAQCADSAERAELLQASPFEGCSGLVHAVGHGYSETISEFADLLVQQYQSKAITNSDVRGIVFHESDGSLDLKGLAQFLGQAPGAPAYIQLIDKLLKAGALNRPDVLDALQPVLLSHPDLKVRAMCLKVLADQGERPRAASSRGVL